MFEQPITANANNTAESIVGKLITIDGAKLRFFDRLELDCSNLADPVLYDTQREETRSSQACDLLNPDLWLPLIVNYLFDPAYERRDLDIASTVALPAYKELKAKLEVGCFMMGDLVPDDIDICHALSAIHELDHIMSTELGRARIIPPEHPLDSEAAITFMEILATTAAASSGMCMADSTFRFAAAYQPNDIIRWVDVCLAANAIQQEPRLAKLGHLIAQNVSISYHWSGERILNALEAVLADHLSEAIEFDDGNAEEINAQVADLLDWFETLDHDLLHQQFLADPNCSFELSDVIQMWREREEIKSFPASVTTMLLRHFSLYESIALSFGCDPAQFYLRGMDDDNAEEHLRALTFYLRAADFIDETDPAHSFVMNGPENIVELGFIKAGAIWLQNLMQDIESQNRSEGAVDAAKKTTVFPVQTPEVATKLSGLYDAEDIFINLADVVEASDESNLVTFFFSSTPLVGEPKAIVFIVAYNDDTAPTVIKGYSVVDGEELDPEFAQQLTGLVAQHPSGDTIH